MLFAAADDEDKFHRSAVSFLRKLGEDTVIATSALFEFDLVMRSRGLGEVARTARFVLLLQEFPQSATAVHRITPATFFLAFSMQGEHRLDYFDTLVAAEAFEHDGKVVSSDREFDRLGSLTRIGL